MKRILAWMAVFCLFGTWALAEDPAQTEQAPQAVMEPAGPGERPMGMGRGERPDGMGGGGGRGGNMAQSEPDEALKAILAEVQDQYQLLTFTDPETGFEM